MKLISGRIYRPAPIPHQSRSIQYIPGEDRTPDQPQSAALRLLPGPRLKLAFVLAADLVQLIGFPLFVEGAASPADDIVDGVLCVTLSLLLGWHWEFAPSFAAKLIPGVDLVPLWTLAVANVYRKERRLAAAQIRQATRPQ
ncbi:MAG: hypothetical protein P4L03_06020 [Terracidiphilus sp.]|nr:hypothetical protein [Terracidiphilus sp.]